MRCYVIKVGKIQRYAATSAEAREVRQKMVDTMRISKRDIDISQIELPTTPKAEFLRFLNELIEDLQDGS